LRFRERYRLHQNRRRRVGFDVVRISYIIGGALLILVSALLGWFAGVGLGNGHPWAEHDSR
jgi:hypothetical protein